MNSATVPLMPSPAYATDGAADPSIQTLTQYSRLFIQQSSTGLGTMTTFNVQDDEGRLVFTCSVQRIATPGIGQGFGHHGGHHHGARHWKTIYTLNDVARGGAPVITAVSEANQMLVNSGSQYSVGSVDGGLTGSNYTATSAVGLGAFQIQSQQKSSVGEVDQFNVFWNGQQQVGVMKRGLEDGPAIHSTNFGMTWPKDLDSRAKALLFASGILVYDKNYVSTVFGTGGGIRGAQFKTLGIMAVVFGGSCILMVVIIVLIVVFIFLK